MAEIILPEGAPEEVVTNALVREIDLNAFGATGSLSLITLDNGQDHNRPNTFGPKSVMALNEAITIAEKSASVAIAITGKPFIFAAGADLSGMAFLQDRSQALAIGKLGHDVFRRLGENKKPTFAFINGLARGGGLEVGLHCNYRTVATTAFTGQPECFLGLVPGWGGATILRASGASLVASGPTRGLTEQGPARVGASRLGLWGEPLRHPSRPVGAEKIAVVLFKLDTGCRGP
jgi:hypothetical protein